MEPCGTIKNQSSKATLMIAASCLFCLQPKDLGSAIRLEGSQEMANFNPVALEHSARSEFFFFLHV